MENRIEQKLDRKTYFINQLVATIFHPVFIPIYLFVLILFLPNEVSVGLNIQQKKQILIILFFNVMLLPIVTILLLKGLDFNKSILLKSQKDRIIPYISSGIYFFWCYYVFKNKFENDPIFYSFIFGLFICISAAVFLNNFFKISMHGMAMGGALMFILLYTINGKFPYPFILAITAFVAGLVGTSRLLSNSHTPKELYWGYALGSVCQLISYLLV